MRIDMFGVIEGKMTLRLDSWLWLLVTHDDLQFRLKWLPFETSTHRKRPILLVSLVKRGMRIFALLTLRLLMWSSMYPAILSHAFLSRPFFNLTNHCT